MVDSLHTSEIPAGGALIKVLQCDKAKKKTTPSSGPPPSMPPRQRASTLGVITEILDGSPKQGLPPSTSSGGSRNNRLNRSRNLSASSSNSSFHGSDSKDLSALPVVAGQIKAFGDKANRGQLRIEDRVVVHPSDPSPSTSYLRDTEFRVVSDVSYLVPISTHVPMKLAALMAGRGLSIFDAVIQAKLHVQQLSNSQNSNVDRDNTVIKILVICNDEFSMMAVQLIVHFLKEFKILVALAALKDEGLMWYKKNMPSVKLIQWNSDAYDQDLVERTSDACQGKVDVVMGCLGLGAPLQRSFKCLKKGGTAFVTEEINEKVLKSLQKLADQNNVKIVEKPTGSIVGTVDDLKNLLNLVAEKQIQPAFLQEEQNLQPSMNPVEMRRKARSLSSRATTASVQE